MLVDESSGVDGAIHMASAAKLTTARGDVRQQLAHQLRVADVAAHKDMRDHPERSKVSNTCVVSLSRLITVSSLARTSRDEIRTNKPALPVTNIMLFTPSDEARYV